MIELLTLPLGPIQTNCYIVADSKTKHAAVIDPSWDGETIVTESARRGWNVQHILLTHAHFDHFGGCGRVASATGAPVGMHRLDLPLWRAKGGADAYGLPMDAGPEPSVWLEPGQEIAVGGLRFNVLFVPGHTPGHVAFHEAAHAKLFSGDVIFDGGIGRTDFPGGSYPQLMESIRSRVLTLPDETEIHPGHGPMTTVGRERVGNPFLAE